VLLLYLELKDLFAAIEDRGNVETGFTAAGGLDEFDSILKNLDTQGAIEENMLFLQSQTSLDFDDMLSWCYLRWRLMVMQYCLWFI
jgi:hypothetical protein